MIELFKKISSEDINSTLVNIGLGLTLLVSLSGIFIHIYKSMIYDTFDLQLMSKEKKQRFYLTKKILYVLFGGLLFVCIFILVGTIFEQSMTFKVILLLMFIVVFFAFIFWSIFFNFIFELFLQNKLSHKEKSFKKFNFIIYNSFLLLSGMLFGVLYVEIFNKKDFDDPLIYFGHFPMLIMGIIIILLKDIEVPLKTTKYKFVDTYKGKAPYELFLDYQIDNNTSVLSSKNGKYKAIKYTQYNDSTDYIIELYEKVILDNPSNSIRNSISKNKKK